MPANIRFCSLFASDCEASPAPHIAPTQVLALQFSTQLTFLAMKPFQLEFFLMLAQKTVLHVLLKGGLLLKLHIRLRG